jgi:hypothetical protein
MDRHSQPLYPGADMSCVVVQRRVSGLTSEVPANQAAVHENWQDGCEMHQRVGVLACLTVTALTYTAKPAPGDSAPIVGWSEHVVGVDLRNNSARKDLR